MVHYIQFHLHLFRCVFSIHNYDKNKLLVGFLKTGNGNNTNYQVLEENNRGMNLQSVVYEIFFCLFMVFIDTIKSIGFIEALDTNLIVVIEKLMSKTSYNLFELSG